MSGPRLERWVAAALERGVEGAAAEALGRLWEQASRRARGRPLTGHRALVAVTGATLGGSWKTPVSLALAGALVERGLRVGLLGHGYRRQRVEAMTRAHVRGEVSTASGVDEVALVAGVEEVTAASGVEQVGDEAWLAGRRLGPRGVRVAIGPREPALRWLEREAEIVVADGLSRANGARSTVVLAVDGRAPWGAGRCPPAGDLRAPIARLLGEAGHVVAVVDELTREPRPAGWWRAEASLTLPELTGERVAVVTAVARPGRFVEALERRGVAVTARVALPDHGGAWAGAEAERGLRGRSFDRVLCTEKCAAWLPATLAGRPVTAVGLELRVPVELVDRLAALVLSSGEPNC